MGQFDQVAEAREGLVDVAAVRAQPAQLEVVSRLSPSRLAPLAVPLAHAGRSALHEPDSRLRPEQARAAWAADAAGELTETLLLAA